MNEEERAERFARDLDQFLFGGISGPPPDLDDHDLSSLFDVARRRVDKSDAARQQAARYESDAWEKLLSSLDAAGEPATGTLAIDGDAVDSMDMRDVISLRRQLAEDALSLAEQHRDDVWNRINERVADDNGKRQPVLAMSDAQATHSQPSFTADDPEFGSLVRIALGSAHAPHRDPEVTQRLWARVGGFPSLRDLEMSFDDSWTGTSVPPSLTVKAVGFAAVAALLVAVIGPIPATGLADHPLVEAASRIAHATGAIEPNDPSSGTPLGAVPDEGHVTTATDARSLLGPSVG